MECSTKNLSTPPEQLSGRLNGTVKHTMFCYPRYADKTNRSKHTMFYPRRYANSPISRKQIKGGIWSGASPLEYEAAHSRLVERKIIMANVKFLTGTYAQYKGLATKDANTLYFIEGQLFKGETSYTNQIEVVDTLPVTMVAGKVYVNTTDKSVTYYDGTASTVVVPETVAAIGDSTADTALASVKAIKDFVAAELAKIPAAVDYTVTITDETAGTGEKSKQTIKQGKAGEETTIGTITVPNLVMTVKETPTEGYLKTYQFTYGTGTPFEVDIPKDLVVTAGEIIVVSDDAPVTGLTNGTYLKLTIANQTAPVYIDVKDLADVYTGKAETTGVSVAISASNEISATLVGKAVAEENLADTLATKVNGADEALTWGAIS